MSRPSSESVLCVEHCDVRLIFLGPQLPAKCPRCGQPLEQDGALKSPPISLPSPLCRAEDHPCCIVVKPTHGDLVNDYRRGDLLHVAVTNSKGRVVEFDHNGVIRDRTLDWRRCLVVDVAKGGAGHDVVKDPDWPEYWDLCLENTINKGCSPWLLRQYDESTGTDCLGFVLAFLASLRQSPFSDVASDDDLAASNDGVVASSAARVEFCRRHVVSTATSALRYIGVVRRLRQCADGVLATPLDTPTPDRTPPDTHSEEE